MAKGSVAIVFLVALAVAAAADQTCSGAAHDQACHVGSSDDETSLLAIRALSKGGRSRRLEAGTESDGYCCWWSPVANSCSACQSDSRAAGCGGPPCTPQQCGNGFWCSSSPAPTPAPPSPTPAPPSPTPAPPSPTPAPPSPTPPPAETLESCLKGPGSSEWTYVGEDQYEVSGYNMKNIHNQRVTDSIKPSAIVFANEETHVLTAMSCAYKFNKPIYGRSGMNQYEASCSDELGGGGGCILMDTSNLMKLDWPSYGCQGGLGACQVSMGPGLSLGSAYTQMSYKGYTLPTGTCAQVRVAGLTLGGGKGWLTRKHGLTLDRLAGIDAVLLNGTKVHANEDSEPHLYWLARGGGGNIFPGVVTAFYYNLVPMPQSPGTYSMHWDWDPLSVECRGKVMAQWYEQLAINSDLDIFSRISLQNWGTPQIVVELYYYGTDKSSMEQKLWDVDSAACGGGQMSTPNPDSSWMSIVEGANGNPPLTEAQLTSNNCAWSLVPGSKPTRTQCYGWDAEYSDPWAYRSLVMGKGGVPQEVWDTLGSQQMYKNFYIEIDPSNGATADVKSDATAYPWRDAGYVTMQQVMRYENGGPYGQTSIQDQISQSAEMMRELTKSVPAKGYYNYLDKDMSSYNAVARDVYYGANADTVEAYLKEYTEGLGLTNGCMRCESWELRVGG